MNTNPDFPTGRWKGFYIEGANRTRHAVGISIMFESGKIRGIGKEDDTGIIFAVHGTYDSKTRECNWTEQRNRYKIHAKGYRDSMKVSIWGCRESERGERSGFVISPAGKEHLDGLVMAPEPVVKSNERCIQQKNSHENHSKP